MAIIIDGKELAIKVKMQVKEDVLMLKKQEINPKLAVILVGDNPASKIYVRNKSKACKDVQIEFEEIVLGQDTTQKELLKIISKLNDRDDIHGILVQLPLPKHIDENIICDSINFAKDVDGFHPVNIGMLAQNRAMFIPCTPNGIIKMLEEYNINLKGANVVVVGRSNIVGKPLAQCLLNKDATVTICHSKTRNLKEITRTADIVISCVGNKKFITKDMIKENAVIIDVGINRENGKIVGDVDFENVKEKASYITPVPGGVGPMTIAMLLNNVVIATKYLNSIKY